MRINWKTARSAAIAGLLAASAGLAGCETVGDALGIEKSSPDEYAVAPRRPLVMPPDMELRAPQPGATGPSDVNAQAVAAQALAGSGQNPASEAEAPPPAEQGGRTLETSKPPQ